MIGDAWKKIWTIKIFMQKFNHDGQRCKKMWYSSNEFELYMVIFYSDSSTELFLNLYLAKFLDILQTSFLSCIIP